MGPPSSREDRSEARRKKKSFYAALKKQEDSKLAELAEKYRDRARERRDGANPDYQNNIPSGATNAYRAVAPDIKSGLDAAERRRQMIQVGFYVVFHFIYNYNILHNDINYHHKNITYTHKYY